MIDIVDNEITDITIGNTPIEKTYIGSQLAWERQPAVE